LVPRLTPLATWPGLAWPAHLPGDVKYHMGASGSLTVQLPAHDMPRKQPPRQRRVRISIAPNPSHLEAVNPVVMGMVRPAAAQLPPSCRPASAQLPPSCHPAASLSTSTPLAEPTPTSRVDARAEENRTPPA